jgi:hypothetical protein
MKLPEPHELVGLFGSEPQLADRDLPWVYNRLTFSASLGPDEVEVEISPGFGHVALIWRQGDQTRATLELNNVESLEVKEAPPTLVIGFEDSLPLGSLRLQLGPHVSLFWTVDPSN